MRSRSFLFFSEFLLQKTFFASFFHRDEFSDPLHDCNQVRKDFMIPKADNSQTHIG